MRCIYLRAPRTDQSLAIAKMVASSASDVRVGAVWDGRKLPRRTRWYTEHILHEELPQGVQAVPTTAEHTEEALNAGPVRLGRITMAPSALRVYDKLAFLTWADSVGVRAPWTVPGESHDLPEPPLFYKDAHEQGGGRRGIARTYEDLPPERRGLIVQEYIPTPGTYGVAFVATDGEILESVAHHERTSYPTSGGSAVTIIRYEDPTLRELTVRLVRSMRYSGWGLAEFKKDSAGRYVLMEVNAKMWASVEFSFRNCPAMCEALFGVRPRIQGVARMTYVNRALAAVAEGSAASLRGLRGTEAVRYPGTMRQVAAVMRRKYFT